MCSHFVQLTLYVRVVSVSSVIVDPCFSTYEAYFCLLLTLLMLICHLIYPLELIESS